MLKNQTKKATTVATTGDAKSKSQKKRFIRFDQGGIHYLGLTIFIQGTPLPTPTPRMVFSVPSGKLARLIPYLAWQPWWSLAAGKFGSATTYSRTFYHDWR